MKTFARLAPLLVILLLLLQVAQATHIHDRSRALHQGLVLSTEDAATCALCWTMQGTASACHAHAQAATERTGTGEVPTPVIVYSASVDPTWLPRGPPLS